MPNDPGDSSETLKHLLARVAHDHMTRDRESWEEIEPTLALNWGELRGSTAPPWCDISSEVRELAQNGERP